MARAPPTISSTEGPRTAIAVRIEATRIWLTEPSIMAVKSRVASSSVRL
jgi:hypothetical protein